MQLQFSFSWPSNYCSESEDFLNKMPPPTLSVEPKDFLNKGPRVTIFGLQSKANLESAVDQLATHLLNLNVQIIIVLDLRLKKSKGRVYEALENSKIKDRVS
jgi:hypothetical protein